jgi:hypothetical protein
VEILGTANLLQKEREIVLLRETSELRRVVEANVKEAFDTGSF